MVRLKSSTGGSVDVPADDDEVLSKLHQIQQENIEPAMPYILKDNIY
jgi:hypothetical protein